MVDFSQAMTRRTAVKLGAASAVTITGLPGTAAAAVTTRARGRRAHVWRRSTYSELVGQRFAVKGRRLHLRLTSIKNLTPSLKGHENAFALVFHAPRGTKFVNDAPPTLRHPAFGSVQLFLEPGSSTKAWQSFVAVINRVHG